MVEPVPWQWRSVIAPFLWRRVNGPGFSRRQARRMWERWMCPRMVFRGGRWRRP
jgi:hypothetical protein